MRGGGFVKISYENRAGLISGGGARALLFCAAVITAVLSSYFYFSGRFDSFGRFMEMKNEVKQVGKYISKEGAKMEKATFAAGCFWGVEHRFGKLRGVVKTSVGYTGGRLKNPAYEDVCHKDTGHAEAVLLEFDPLIITYDQLLEAFFAMHDPTQLNRQGPDQGDQYRSAIFFHSGDQEKAALEFIARLKKSGKFASEIVTRVDAATQFYTAEEYHQKYLDKKGGDACHL